ncbi:MAG: hypothetical protein FWH46_02185 [Methanimicrococcus sp.]|nr:hypothetical protein [Methanimicrococcus sp.]
MKLDNQDKKRIFEILAEKYFRENQWKYFSISKDAEKVQKYSDEINRQHAAYPSITRDWYIQNSGSRSIHLCDSWEELKIILGFLKIGEKYFDYFVDTGELKAFCVLSATKELEPDRIDMILNAQEAGIKTLVFLSDVPDEIEAHVLQIKRN